MQLGCSMPMKLSSSARRKLGDGPHATCSSGRHAVVGDGRVVLVRNLRVGERAAEEAHHVEPQPHPVDVELRQRGDGALEANEEADPAVLDRVAQHVGAADRVEEGR
eukprot:6711435-Prymnesium_polylepis.1